MRRLLFVFMLFLMGMASAQGTQTVAVKVSNQTQRMNNKEYYVHIVEQGQTLFSIARAYGLKYYDAVIKTDIHLMKVGDTVWLPKNEYSVAAVSANADAVVVNRVHYIKVEAGQTLYGLSREYGVTVEQIVDANPELRNEQLKAGQMLKIPSRADAAAKEASIQEQVAKQKEQEEAAARAVALQRQQEEQARLAAEQQRVAAEQQRVAAEQQRLASEKQKQEEQERLAAEQRKQAEQQRVAAEQRRQQEEQARQAAERQRQAEQAQQQAKSATTAPLDTVIYAGRPPVPPRPVVMPYVFSEVPAGFPTTQAPYYNFSTVSNYNFQVRDRQDKDRIFVTVMMPLHLDQIDSISTSKFDVEQRGKKEYKVFEFIQFYEGILMALDQLQSQGINVVLNVVDLVSDKDADVEEAFQSHQVANSDFVVALLVKKPFQRLAALAKEHQVFVINPFSSRLEVVADNPYVVKCMPSVEGTVSALLSMMRKRYPQGHLYVLHSGSKSSATDEAAYRAELQRQLEAQQGKIAYTFFDWAANGKLIPTLKATNDNVIVSIYDQGKNKNTVFATTLLNRLSAMTSHVPTLVTVSDLLTDYPSLDFDQLQHLNYTAVTTGYLDYGNAKHKKFIDTYKDKFRTEPNTLYAGVAHDIMIYFVTALHRQGAEFWRNPQKFSAPADMLYPFGLKQPSATGGYENQLPDIYQMQNYKRIQVKY